MPRTDESLIEDAAYLLFDCDWDPERVLAELEGVIEVRHIVEAVRRRQQERWMSHQEWDTMSTVEPPRGRVVVPSRINNAA